VTAHVGRVRHRTDGWARWGASCSCGWRAAWGNRAAVEQALTDHAHATGGTVEMTVAS
jgi:hypothetical protein